MYLHLLTPEQGRAFYRAAALLVGSDGRSEGAEIRYLDRARRSLGLGEPPQTPADTGEVLAELAVFDTALSRRVLLVELSRAAIADDQVAPVEGALIRDIAGAWGVGEEHLRQCFDLAKRAKKLTDEGYRLIGG